MTIRLQLYKSETPRARRSGVRMQLLHLVSMWVVLLCGDLITWDVFSLGLVFLALWIMSRKHHAVDVWPVSEHSSTEARAKCTLYLKGMMTRLAYETDATTVATKSITDEVRRLSPACLVWKSDPYDEESYTRLIPRLYQAMRTDLELVAFVSDKDVQRFVRSWKPHHLPITVYTCDDALDSHHLGTLALHATGAMTVFCFGSDDGVEKEFSSRPDSDVSFVTFPVDDLPPPPLVSPSTSAL